MKKTSPQITPDQHFYQNETFRKLCYHGQLINDMEFYQCQFEHCSFTECQIGSYFENCRFEYCDLSVAKLRQCALHEVTFIECRLSGIHWSEAKIPLWVTFDRCLLNFASFVGMTLTKTKFEGCTIKEANFADANLAKSSFKFADLAGSRFVNTNLSGVDFTDARNYVIDPRHNTIRKARFSLPEVIALLDIFDIFIE